MTELTKMKLAEARDALNKDGFSFVEVLSPCPTLFARRNRLGDGLDMQRLFKEKLIRGAE